MERFNHGGDIYSNPDIMLDFSVNTNPLGMPDNVRQALISHINEFVHYPDPQCRKLRLALSQHEEIPYDWILCGNGAADLIVRLCYVMKPYKALVCCPTFSEYERALKQVGCQVEYYFLMAEDEFVIKEDVVELLTPDINVVFLCNPNNPTGKLIESTVLKHILDQAHKNNIKIIVDECFLDFTDGTSCKHYIQTMHGLFVLKAFTKMYAMAGLRLGYLMSANTEILKHISAAAPCWNVSIPAQIAGVEALTCKDFINKTNCLIKEERKYLVNGFEKLGITVFQSDANFLLIRSEYPLYELLLQQDILIRPCDNFIGLDETYYRVGIKTHDENKHLLCVMKEILNG